MNDVEKQRMAEHFALPGPMDRIRQKRKGERAYTNDEIAEHENLAAEIRAKLDDYQPDRMRAALAALRGGAQGAAPDTTIPGTDNMDERFAWLEAKAIDMGYVLVPEPEHPDSPHNSQPPLPGLVTTLRSHADDCENMERWATPELAPLLRRAADVIESGVSPVTEGVRVTPDRDRIWHTIAKHIACETDCQKWPNGCGCAQNAADAVLTLTAARDTEGKPFEIRRNPDGSIDEVVGTVRFVHIEQMSADSWFVAFDTPDGAQQRFWLGAKNRKTEVVFRHDETIPAPVSSTHSLKQEG